MMCKFKNVKLPNSSNKRFLPRNSAIRDHTIHTRRKLCHTLIDQDCVSNKIDKWREDEVKLESDTETSLLSSLLFVY